MIPGFTKLLICGVICSLYVNLSSGGNNLKYPNCFPSFTSSFPPSPLWKTQKYIFQMFLEKFESGKEENRNTEKQHESHKS